ncbi:MAG: alpha/beta hydrolase [Gemmatimonadales bacterium]|nr:alpha/beta hydrolase [Gemmatimonadales bacterium]MYL06480.1 alpha/beta hydrolase [Gemmatimonadales bacterium]
MPIIRHDGIRSSARVSRGRRGRRVLAATTAVAAATVLAVAGPVSAQTEPPAEPPADWEATAIDYSNVPYPHPVSHLDVEVYGNGYRLAYMDVAPAGPANGRTVVLFHGMNFFAAGFRPTIEALRNAGFRVIAIDRLGFGRSSKPIIHYNLHIPARNAKRLLDALGIERAAIVGHSMGGMVATRFASTYPETTTHVAMVNQIGLTDSRPGRGWTDADENYESVLNGTTYQSVLRGHMRYYPNGWRPEYLEWVKVQYGLTLSGDWPRMARVRAAQRAILYEDPVVYEWQHIATKALVIGGADDRLVANYPVLARNVAEELQNAELFLFPEVGHSPQFEIPERFHAELIRFLRSDPNEPADQSWRATDVGRPPGS